ncbi:hypothetical protein GCM10025862_38810 [Arsenicicoccus piscis]|uniref:Rhodanese domain-containing protein n=1 Tax=Arsenicicoccus piscis TaxID=673954 RepID=A0ABQ6HU64_9MICO|nr:hypothetical protein GCM10025862_38810 [Arsenicicoccus piscis]
MALGAAVALGAGALGMTGCTGAPRSVPSASASTIGQTLGVGDFGDLAAKEGTVVVDLRPDDAYHHGHLATAINIDIGAANAVTAVRALDRSKTYALYGETGQMSRTARDMFVANGFTKVYDLAGGIRAWYDAGGEINPG